MPKPHIEYPCWWTYTLIGTDEETLRMAIGALVKGIEHRVAFSKLSAQKKYVSLNVEVWVVSEEQRLELFDAFKSHPSVRYLL